MEVSQDLIPWFAYFFNFWQVMFQNTCHSNKESGSCMKWVNFYRISPLSIIFVQIVLFGGISLKRRQWASLRPLFLISWGPSWWNPHSPYDFTIWVLLDKYFQGFSWLWPSLWPVKCQGNFTETWTSHDTILELELFEVWRIDFMDPFVILFGMKYILIVVDYVLKWVDTIVLPNNEGRSVSVF